MKQKIRFRLRKWFIEPAKRVSTWQFPSSFASWQLDEKDTMTSFEQQLEEFFADCRKQQYTEEQMYIICKPLIWRMYLQMVLRWILWVLPAVLVYLLWNYCDTCAWTASAIGRLLLIQLLPYWDWTKLYNNRCLIERTPPGGEQREQFRPLGKYETQWENCALCETLGKYS